MIHNGMPAGALEADWQKALASQANGDCVNLAVLADGQVAMRNSRDPEGPALIFTKREIAALLDGAKANEFDHMIA